jgi:hypothetical protein
VVGRMETVPYERVGTHQTSLRTTIASRGLANP